MTNPEYSMKVDALHRNRWPVSLGERTVGEIVEHITVALDGAERGVVDWSWYLDDAEAEHLGKHWVPARESQTRYASHRHAFEAFTEFHRLAERSLDGTAGGPVREVKP